MKLNVVGLKPIIKYKTDEWRQGIRCSEDSYDIFNLGNREDLFDNADCFLQFNIYNPYRTVKPSQHLAFKKILNTKKPFLVVEEGPFRQLKNYRRAGWYNYKNGLGLFYNNINDLSVERWRNFLKKNNLKIKNWNSPGDNILIMGQVDYDSALIELYDTGYQSFTQYIEDVVTEIRNYTDRPIVYRPHPKTHSIHVYNREVIDSINNLNLIHKNVTITNNLSDQGPNAIQGGNSLFEDLKDAYCVVTYNSNSAVEALCEGVPIFTLHPTSCAYEVGHHDLSQIGSIDYYKNIDEWGKKIVYTIWNNTEIEEGIAWNYLKNLVFKD